MPGFCVRLLVYMQYLVSPNVILHNIFVQVNGLFKLQEIQHFAIFVHQEVKLGCHCQLSIHSAKLITD